ncbi:LUD domain-containing protein [uncultured Polaribacter sp.]|uniref:LUD domain-containing protein n=1 Tax=uncultured Polaribacter sp. TaxID=174711 RepID=UPI002610A56B|nr:LUD domain-containing protein [uncultured Polaribacter sp.]
MNFFKKLLNISNKEDVSVTKQEVLLSLDDLFVHKFVQKGGKFLYSLKKSEIIENLTRILNENDWKKITVLNSDLNDLVNKDEIQITSDFISEVPVFTTCEHLVAENGDILFSSNQLKSVKLSDMPENFIVFATTSQLVKDIGQGLTGIKLHHKENLPTNISAIKNYNILNKEENFLNYGNSNSKNLYLLLLEDL